MKMLTQDEAARRLGVSQSTIKRLRLDGKLTYIPGRPVLIDQADLDAYTAVKAEADAKKKVQNTETPAELARRIWIVRRVHASMKAKSRTKQKS
ncbi:MAG: helix-turn-helix domain-containing protein [Phyllobacterium sp.]